MRRRYTTFAVMMVTFFIGALVYIGERSVAASLGSGALRWRVLTAMALTTAAGVASLFLG